jgi:hypothetical protein
MAGGVIMKRLAASCACVALFVCASTIARSQAISGVVRDDDGRPVAGMEVDAVDPTYSSVRGGKVFRAVTDERGHYVLSGVPPGAVILLGATGSDRLFPSNYARVEVPPTGIVTQDLMTAHPSSIAGKVMDQAGAPVAGALVLALDGIVPLPLTPFSNPRHPGAMETSADGRFTIAVRKGTFSLRVRKRGLPEFETSVTAPNLEVVLKLPTGERVSGIVVDAKGMPLARVEVLAEPRDIAAGEVIFDRRMGLTDERGRFEILGLKPGRHWLKVTDAVKREWWAEAVLPAAGSVTVAFPTLKTIRGQILNKTGVPNETYFPHIASVICRN